MGAYQSSCTFTATAVAERYGVPSSSGNSSALNITDARLQMDVFRATPIATDYARTYMRFFADMKKEGKKIDSIAIVNENTDYGTSVGDAIEAEAKKSNVPVAIRIPYSASSTDCPRAGPAAEGQEAGCRNLHQLYGRRDPLHQDAQKSRLRGADGASATTPDFPIRHSFRP